MSKGRLDDDEWNQFNKLYLKVEGWNFMATRDHAIEVLKRVNPQLAVDPRMQKASVNEILNHIAEKLP